MGRVCPTEPALGRLPIEGLRGSPDCSGEAARSGGAVPREVVQQGSGDTLGDGGNRGGGGGQGGHLDPVGLDHLGGQLVNLLLVIPPLLLDTYRMFLVN